MNKQIQSQAPKDDWISPKVEIRDSSAGKGMFAKVNIPQGEALIAFGGTYTDKKTALAEKLKKDKLIMQWDDDLYSVETRGGSEGYFINHSCDANLWMRDAFTLEAKRDINVGEELTADYALWEADENWKSKWECKCGSPFCRHRITGKDWRDPEVQIRYKDHFSPLINRRISELNKHEDS